MKFHPTPLALALAAALGSLAVLPAQAALITSNTLSGSLSITDGQAAGATTYPGLPVVLLGGPLTQFDPDLGVLMGTSLNLTGTRSTTVAAVGSGNDKANKKSEGTGASALSLAAPGVTTYTSGSVSVDSSCNGKQSAGCSNTTSSPITPQSLAVGDLSAYVGTGAVSGVTATATTLSAEQTLAGFDGAETTTHAISASVQAEYQYLLHAAPSIDDDASPLTLILDFGEVFQYASVTPLAFSIFNAAGDRVGLDLDSFDTISGPFSTNLAKFLGLAAGADEDFLASFDTSAVGVFNHSYTLYLSDANVGAESSRYSYTMTLNLIGEVTPGAVNGVPEPGVLALASLGLLGLALTRRRQRPG